MNVKHIEMMKVEFDTFTQAFFLNVGPTPEEAQANTCFRQTDNEVVMYWKDRLAVSTVIRWRQEKMNWPAVPVITTIEHWPAYNIWKKP